MVRRFPIPAPVSFRFPLTARRPRAAVAAMLVSCLLPLGACSFVPSQECVPEGSSVSPAEVVGTYKGLRDAKDVSLTLEAEGERPGVSEGRVTVKNWPTGDWYQPELGDTFDGSGTWEFLPATKAAERPMVSLTFTEPRGFGANDTLDMLSAAADSDRIVLFEDDDPDICPRFRLETGKD